MDEKDFESMSREELIELLKKYEKQRIFFQKAVDSLPNPVFIKDDNLHFIVFNEAYRKFFFMKEGQFIGMGVKDLPFLTPEDQAHYHEEDTHLLETASVIHYEASYPIVNNPRDSLYWSRGFVTEDGQRGIVGEIVDISEKKSLEKELRLFVERLERSGERSRLESLIDPLTRVYNRRYYNTNVPALFQRCLDDEKSLAVFIIDIDNFKTVNDTFGHEQGDIILKNISATLSKNIRSDDILIRFGGDEFVIVMPVINEDLALKKADKICLEVNANLVLPDDTKPSVSIGIASLRHGDEGIDDVFKRADIALYESKKNGRNQATLYNQV